MTKEDRIQEIAFLKNELSKIKKESFNAFDNFWPNNDHENVKKLCNFLIYLTEISDDIQEKTIKIVRQCHDDYEKSAPYICDMLLREWNRTVMRANDDFGDLINELTEKQSGSYKDTLDKLISVDMKINKLFLSEYLDEE